MVNDLATCGARPLCLSAGFVLEEGLPAEAAWRVVQSMKAAADAVGVPTVTGHTKVVERRKGDGVFINTAGTRVEVTPNEISSRRMEVGNCILLSGDIGQHGISGDGDEIGAGI